MVKEEKDLSASDPASCLILRQLLNVVEAKKGLFEQRNQHCSKLNLHTEGTVIMQKIGEKYDKRVKSLHEKFWHMPPEVVLSFLLIVMQRIGHDLSLTPRHVLSLIRNLFLKGCKTKVVYMMFGVVLMGMVSGSEGARLITSNQKLPPACVDWFLHRGEDCPIKANWDPSWNNLYGVLNETCCSGFPGTQLHCQRNGSTNFPACLPDQPVPPGHSGRLDKDTEGNPQFVLVPCDPHKAFEPARTVSSNITFPHCLHQKSRCRGEGVEVLCHGGGSADDLCVCSVGYMPGDAGCNNFTGNDVCWCEAFSCPPSQAPQHSVRQVGPCLNLTSQVFVNTTCVTDLSPVTPPTPTGPSLSQATLAPGGGSVNTPPSQPETDSGVGFLRALPVIIGVLYLVGLAFLVWVARGGDGGRPRPLRE
ncbi:hypothetical protein ACOMHN_017984 [Nucella lapillus]